MNPVNDHMSQPEWILTGSTANDSNGLTLQHGSERFDVYTSPREVLLAYCKWNDPNGEYDDMDATALCEVVRSWA